MRRIRKLLALIIGLSILAIFGRFDIEVAGLDAFVIELAISAATAWGVYQVPNDYS